MAVGQIKQKKSQIRQDIFENLCANFNTEKDIAAIFGVHPNTIYTWCLDTYGKTFPEVYQMFGAQRRASLRQAIYKKATKGGKDGMGDPAVLIFMAKNHLGMADKTENDNVEKVQIVNDLKDD